MSLKLGKLYPLNRLSKTQEPVSIYCSYGLVTLHGGPENTELGWGSFTLDSSRAPHFQLPRLQGARAAATVPHLDVNRIDTTKGNSNFYGLGRGLMVIFTEISFLTDRHGTVVAYASPQYSVPTRHPGPFYQKFGYKPAYRIGDTRNEQLTRSMTDALENNTPFSHPDGFFMTLREGLDSEALKARKAQLALPPKQRNPNAILDTATQGTKAHRMKEIFEGRALLDELNQKYRAGSIILD